jgi:hypothetical protein
MMLAVSLLSILFATNTSVTWLGLVAAGGSLASLVLLVTWWRRPRLAYFDGELEVYLTGRRPIRVPIEVVECFFKGQGPSLLPGFALGGRRLEAATLIVRLAERAVQWKHRDVRPWLGLWCEGYITIRGTCCEPLHGDLVARLNRRLVEIHRQTRNEPHDQAVGERAE